MDKAGFNSDQPRDEYGRRVDEDGDPGEPEGSNGGAGSTSAISPDATAASASVIPVSMTSLAPPVGSQGWNKDDKVSSDLIGGILVPAIAAGTLGVDGLVTLASRISSLIDALGSGDTGSGAPTPPPPSNPGNTDNTPSPNLSDATATDIAGNNENNNSGNDVSATEHGVQRAAGRGITNEQIQEAISSAETSGNITTQTGKYGTPQKVYKGTNGVTVVIETTGRNAGKVITTWSNN